jgi:hypothetical protein
MKPTDEEYLQHLDTSISEKEWQQEANNGFIAGDNRFYHTKDSRHSPKGFPDLIVPILGGVPDLLVIELKVGDNKPSSEQLWWLDAFAQSGALTFCLWPRHRKVLERLYLGDVGSYLASTRIGVYTKRG